MTMVVRGFLRRAGVVVCAAAVLLSGSLLAAPYVVGDAVEVFSAKDQHGKEFTLEPGKVRFLLFSHDMDAGKAANVVLDRLGKDYLGTKGAVYVANIHGMPGIGRKFALPKMRKYAHRIVLGDDAALIGKFPGEKGKVAVLKLAGGKVASVAYWNPAVEELDEKLK